MSASVGRSRAGHTVRVRSDDVERRAIDQAVADGRPILNWPPSRGPKPACFEDNIDLVTVPPRIALVPFKKRHRLGEAMDAPRRPLVPKAPPPLKGLGAEAQLRHYPRRLAFDLSVSVDAVRSMSMCFHEVISGALDRAGRKGARDWDGPVVSELPARALTFDLTCPLDVIARVTISPFLETVSGLRMNVDGSTGKPFRATRKRMHVGYLCRQLAKAYGEIYAEHKTYGVWGHALADLYFERFEIRDDIGRVYVGS